MRKLIGLVLVLFLLSVVAQAQDSAPVDITLSATIEQGCFLEISPTSVSWLLGVNAQESAWVSGNVPLFFLVKWRVPEGHEIQFMVESVTDLVYEDLSFVPIEDYIQQVVTGDITGNKRLPAVVDGAVLVIPNSTSTDLNGMWVGQIYLRFNDDPIGFPLKAGTMTATIQYTVVDI